MKNLKDALHDLQDLVNYKIKEYDIPIQVGKSVRIKNLLIRPSKTGYVLIDMPTNKSLLKTYTKIGAIAAAKLYLQNKPLNIAINYDYQIEKNLNDIVFYSNCLNKTTDNEKMNNLKIRKDLANEKIYIAKYNLNEQIVR